MHMLLPLITDSEIITLIVLYAHTVNPERKQPFHIRSVCRPMTKPGGVLPYSVTDGVCSEVDHRRLRVLPNNTKKMMECFFARSRMRNLSFIRNAFKQHLHLLVFKSIKHHPHLSVFKSIKRHLHLSVRLREYVCKHLQV
ncbi:hypothetical protein Tcan_00232 [Toxocara canis]|uniref:Uncharacterized protein n=1 Tax=Toxocara canis TaxID=6265 RepID=A0A0B2UZ13_TOXCA|nr:hypothetical protein Tcan_00232 [Toxocara canis]